MARKATDPGTVLTGAAVLTMDAGDRLLACADIRIIGHLIEGIGVAGSPARRGDEVVDCGDTLIMPGLVNTHTHACAGLFRGLTEDLPREHWNGS
jgi:5-methylthioadenosine/S-adenosylhomocysteine deaminase